MRRRGDGGDGGTASSKTGPAAAAGCPLSISPWRTRDRHLGSGGDDVTGIYAGHGRFIHCRRSRVSRMAADAPPMPVLRRGKPRWKIG